MLPFPVIMGATASGKSSVALELARRMNGEIVSADSMQVYTGLDAGTAKPSAAEIAEIPHHLVNIRPVSSRYDLFSFVSDAEKAIGGIRSRGRLPIVAGGTGLYLRALMYGLDEMPTDEALRKKLDDEFDSGTGFEKLKNIMAEKAPDDLERWSLHRRKLIRAYEVFLLSGKSITSMQKRWKSSPPRSDAVQFVIQWDRAELKRRIRSRCEKMLGGRWLEEVARMRADGLFSAPTAWQVLGYREVADFLDGKIPSTEKLADAISTVTWQFARRQLTWFRGQHRDAVVIPMPVSDADAAAFIEKTLKEKALR